MDSKPTGPCGYLMHNDTYMGALYLQWSETEVEGALARLDPARPPPKFKMTSNHGQEPFIQPAQPDGPHKQRYWEGIIMFVKKAQAMNSHVTVYEQAPVALWGRQTDGQVVPITPDETLPSDGFDAIACGARDSAGFGGVKMMQAHMFAAKNGSQLAVKSLRGL